MLGIIQNLNSSPEKFYADYERLGLTSRPHDDQRFEQIFGIKVDSNELNEIRETLSPSTLHVLNFQRSTGLSGLMDGHLLAKGYTHCDIMLASYLKLDETGKTPPKLELPMPEGSQPPEISPERLSRLSDIRKEQSRLGKDFKDHYKEPAYLARFLADGVKGWNKYNLKRELETHLDRPITKESYEQLMEQPNGMALVAMVGYASS